MSHRHASNNNTHYQTRESFTMKPLFTLLFSASALSLATTASGADAMNADQVQALFAGKTAAVTVVANGLGQRTYFAKDGKLAQVNDKGERRSGTWRVDAGGSQCILWSGEKEVCDKIVPQGNGIYQRYRGAKHIVTINKIVDGNPYDLK
jgi:hypothetical protein